jgi:hypothetical protein
MLVPGRRHTADAADDNPIPMQEKLNRGLPEHLPAQPRAPVVLDGHFGVCDRPEHKSSKPCTRARRTVAQIRDRVGERLALR